jgi:hypothetical protein
MLKHGMKGFPYGVLCNDISKPDGELEELLPFELSGIHL